MKVTLTPLKNGVTIGRGDATFILAQIQAGEELTTPNLPLSLALVLDRSGSMRGAPLAEAKKCIDALAQKLDLHDRLALIVYNHRVQTLIKTTSSDEFKSKLPSRLRLIQASQNTALYDGWSLGVEQLLPEHTKHRLCRVVLLSDGAANHGPSNPKILAARASRWARLGISTTTVGLGAAFNELLMSAMAKGGLGQALYGERVEDLQDAFQAEVDLLKSVVWRDVRISVGDLLELEVMNGYQDLGGQWQLPILTRNAEAWVMFKAPPETSEALVSEGLRVWLSATNNEGRHMSFEGSLPPLPQVRRARYLELEENEVVKARLVELAAAELQMKAFEAAHQDDWDNVERLLRKLDILSKDYPWLSSSLSHLWSLMEERDPERMGKELYYKSRFLRERLARINEPAFDSEDEKNQPSHLRRKLAQGRSV